MHVAPWRWIIWPGDEADEFYAIFDLISIAVMSLKKFLTSTQFFKHLVLAGGGSLLLVGLVIFMLRFYTRHSESFEVPDLYGYTVQETAPLIARYHLRYQIVDSTYIEDLRPGAVVEQLPRAGHRVKRNRTLQLTINRWNPEQVAVPRLTDISLRQSLAQLEAAGLQPGEISMRPSEFQNLVLQATIQGRDLLVGELVPRGASVDLVVGTTGLQDQVHLPDFKGLTLDLTLQIMEELMLSTGAIIYDSSVQTAADSLYARVWRQQPDPALIPFINRGATVDLWVTTREEIFQTPDQTEESGETESFF